MFSLFFPLWFDALSLLFIAAFDITPKLRLWPWDEMNLDTWRDDEGIGGLNGNVGMVARVRVGFLFVRSTVEMVKRAVVGVGLGCWLVLE